MKLATLRAESRDGKLVVVSRDLKKAVLVESICSTLQQAVESWHVIEPQLQEQYELLNAGHCQQAIDFDVKQVCAPLPRAYQWADGSAYVNHVELVRKARGAQMPENFWTDPLMYQGGSDAFLGACEPIHIEDLSWGVDFEAEIAVITTDVSMGTPASTAGQQIALFMLVNDVSLRNLIPNEIAKGFGFFQSKPSSAFSPVAITADEFAQAWDGKKVHLPLTTHLNDKLFGEPEAGADMTFDFPTLIAHAAKTRPLAAGAIIGSGTVSNVDRSKGSSCLAEKRMLEIIESGSAKTPFMQYGDRVKIEMWHNNESLFGAIDQEVVPYEK